MIFRNLDENDDWTFGKGKQNYLRTNNAILLNIKTRLLSFYKNCFFDTEAGIDWFTRMNNGDQFSLLKNDVKNAILQSEGVVEIVTLDIIFENRIFTASYTIKTIYSPSVKGEISQSF